MLIVFRNLAQKVSLLACFNIKKWTFGGPAFFQPSRSYWRWTVPLNNAQMGLVALGDLQSRGANGRPHTSLLV